LKEACLVALANQQGVGDHIGEIDFSKPTKAFTAPNQSHPGWQCWIHPEDNVSGYDNHELVEAFKPAKSYLGGLWKVDEQDIWFDRAL
jgi:hypothetical protein